MKPSIRTRRFLCAIFLFFALAADLFAQAKPSITTQPTNQEALILAPANFVAAVSGQSPIDFRWYHNGAAVFSDLSHVIGAASEHLEFIKVYPNDAGNYWLTAANRHGMVTSAVVTLTVLIPPYIFLQPNDVSTNEGSNVTFSADVSGVPDPTPRWFFNGTLLNDGGRVSGATTKTLSISNAQLADAGGYSFFATNKVGNATSRVAQLIFLRPPILVSQPQSQAVIAGQTASFSVAASGAEPMSFQLRFNGENIYYLNGTGGTNWTFDLTNVHPGNQGNYTIVVSNEFGSVITSNAFLTVLVPPAFSQQPQTQSKAVASSVTFSANANGTAPLSYQWFYNNAPLSDGGAVSGATTASLSLVNLQTNNSGNYYAVVTNVAGISTSSIANLTVLFPVSVDQQPTNQTIIAGANVQFSVIASGGEPINYGWRLNGTALFNSGRISGAQSTVLTISNVQPSDAGSYAVQVINPVSSIPSSNVVLTVLSPPSFLTQPASQNRLVGSNVTFSATANGSTPIFYQWFFNDSALADDGRIAGATTNFLTIANLQTNDSGAFRIVASNSVGVVTSVVANLFVSIPPTFAVQPTNQTLVAGSSASFFAMAEGTEPLRYQWFRNGVMLFDDARLSGTTTNLLSISPVQTGDAGNYTVVVTNLGGAATSAVAVATVVLPPSITTQPRGYSVPVGLPVALSAIASGTAPLSYQWLLNGAPVSNATSNKLSITNFAASQAGNYQLVVTNNFGAITSSVAPLTIGPVAIWGTYGQVAVFPLWPKPGLSNVIAVAGGSSYSLALQEDGTVYAWGISTATNIPAGLSNVVGIAAGPSHALALRSDGMVVAWGSNSSGQTNVPVGLSNVVALAAGTSHSAALCSDGTVLVWGSGSTGQTNVPAGLMNVAAISSGGSQNLVLRNRSVLSWGNPVALFPPAGLTNIVSIASGAIHNVVLTDIGTVRCWADTALTAVTAVPFGLNNVVQIAANRGGGSDFRSGYSLALNSGGIVTAWGFEFGGTTVVPAALSNVVSVAAGDTHALAIVGDGRPLILKPPVGGTFYTGSDVVLKSKVSGNAPLTFRWRKNGTLINGATNSTLILSSPVVDFSEYQLVVSNAFGVTQSIPAPVRIIDSAPVITLPPINQFAYYGSPLSIAATVVGSGPMQLTWLRDGVVYGAATNELVFSRALPEHGGAYQLVASNAFGSVTSSVAQVTFSRIATWGSGPKLTNAPLDLGTVKAVASGYFHALAIRADNTVAAWGTTLNGATNVTPGLSDVVAISGGSYFSLALKSDGTVAAWGLNSSGQTTVPVGLNNVIAISAGGSHALALRGNGTVAAWGLNSSGQINVPAGLSNVVAISAGSVHSLALKKDGSMVGWGMSGTIPTTTTTVAISAGYKQSLALQADGTVLQWTTDIKSLSVPSGLNNIVAISCGGGFQGSAQCAALKSDGTIVAWAESNSAGQMNVPPEIVSTIFLSAGGSSTLAFLNDRSPAVTIPLLDRHANAGSTVTLPAMAVGQAPLNYQWRFNGTNIPGATAPALNFAGVTRATRGNYSAVISNSFGITNTRSMQLEVSSPLNLSTPRLDANGNVFFSAQEISGNPVGSADVAFFEAQTSTNLVDWLPLPGGLSFTNGNLFLRDGENTNYPARFYRILEK